MKTYVGFPSIAIRPVRGSRGVVLVITQAYTTTHTPDRVRRDRRFSGRYKTPEAALSAAQAFLSSLAII